MDKKKHYKVTMGGNPEIKVYNSSEFQLLQKVEENQNLNFNFSLSKTEHKKLASFLGMKTDVKPELLFQSIIKAIIKNRIYEY